MVNEKGKPTAPKSKLNNPGESSSQLLGALPPTIRQSVKPKPQYMPAMIAKRATLVQWNLAFSSPAQGEMQQHVESRAKCRPGKLAACQ
jgi:hypothetical protein